MNSEIKLTKRAAGPATTFSVRLWGAQLDLIQRAAKGATLNLPSYVLDRLLPQAARDLGEELPMFPEMRRRLPQNEGVRSSSDVSVEIAAQRLGMTVAQYKDHVVKAATEQILASLALAPRTVSGMHRR